MVATTVPSGQTRFGTSNGASIAGLCRAEESGVTRHVAVIPSWWFTLKYI